MRAVPAQAAVAAIQWPCYHCSVNLNDLSRQLLGAREPLFEQDFADNMGRIRQELAGRTVMVIGAGGTIGRATAQVLLEQQPKRTLLVDVSENNLVELTRSLRNAMPQGAPDFEAWPMDFTGPPFIALLEKERPDIVLNFAAFKHVRSEKDSLTIAELLRVNVIGNLGLLRWARENGPLHRAFVISTDKAVNPASVMGATKRLMETVLFAAGESLPAANFLTSTRFANVLFSDGSLTQSFLERLEQGQPLTGPSDIERYFISPREAGMLCLLAACHEGSGEMLVPRMRGEDLMFFPPLAERLLKLRGFEPREYGADVAGAFSNLEADRGAGYWPTMFTPSSTDGEKAFEEFVEDGEAEAGRQPYRDISVLLPKPLPGWEHLRGELAEVAGLLSDPQWLARSTKAQLVEMIRALVPSFSHIETGMSLDKRV
jgi:FlaA1/EpsC-like NDP-sugar epimerase